MKLILLFFCLTTIKLSESSMIYKECPIDEVHKSCSFYDEYTCWVDEKRFDRVRSGPKRLTHCKSGCFCKKGLVREYPGGPCIMTSGCRDQRLKMLLEKLPYAYQTNRRK